MSPEIISWEEQDCCHLLFNATQICKMQFHWSSWIEWLGINQSASATHQPHEILYFLFIIWGRPVLYWSKDNPGFLPMFSVFSTSPTSLPTRTAFLCFSHPPRYPWCSKDHALLCLYLKGKCLLHVMNNITLWIVHPFRHPLHWYILLFMLSVVGNQPSKEVELPYQYLPINYYTDSIIHICIITNP